MNLSRREVMKLIAGSLPAYYASSALAQAVATAPATSAAPAAAASPGLKDAYKGKFLIGCATDPGNLSDDLIANIKANYNVITPENCMKPQPIHPSEDTYNWTSPDTLVKWCEDNKIKVHGHTLAWHSQTAPWFFQAPAGEQTLSREMAMERLKKHILTVVGRYKGRIVSWDVVNEAINDNGNGETENLRNAQWIRAIGPDYLTMAFKWAHEADPDCHLYYNDYSIDGGAVKNTGKHASSMLLLKRLIAEGAPIYGVGIQGHWHLDTNMPDVDKAIENYKSLGLKVSISELDITATGTNSGALNPNAVGGTRRGTGRGADANTPAAAPRGPAAMAPAQNSVMAAIGTAPGDANAAGRGAGRGAGGMGFGGGMMGGGRGGGTVTPELLQKQAEVYKQLFEILRKYSDTIERVTFWGLSDSRSWRSGQFPLLFDGQLQPKPAFKAVIDVGLGK
jgi:endo-1,4-beta-xylanase